MRTTSQGLTVIDSGDPGTAIAAGMPTGDTVDAALAKVAVNANALVTPDRTTFAIPPKNLYNPADVGVQVGFVLVLNSTGTAAASANYTTTGYIPVVAGQAYTISNPRNAVLYNTVKGFVSQVDNPAQGPLTITPVVAGFLRASFNTATYQATFQAEKGSSATAYAVYAITMPGLLAEGLTGAALNLATSSPVDASRTTFATLSKNLFNPATATVNALLVLGTAGGTTAYAGYTSSDYITVTAGQAYTSKARHHAWYNTAHTYFAASADNAAQTAITVTAPAGAAYLRVDFSTTATDTMQVEKGSAATSYDAYGVTIASLKLATAAAGPVTLTKAGDTLSIASLLGASILSITATVRNTATNNAFNLTAATIDGISVHLCSDDVTPIRTQLGTIGANHGYACVAAFVNPDAKTVADLGSVWTDGTREYVLLAIDSTGKLIIGGSYTTSGGITNSVTAAPTSDLTHVSGATHTGTIAFATQVTGQLYPSTGRVQVAVSCDGAPVLTDGIYKGRQITVRESYDIYNYADLYDKAKANIGVSYTTLAVAGEVRITNTFAFAAAGRCRVTSSLTALRPTTIGQSGFLQSVSLTKAGAATWRYVPGLAAISGYDFAAGVDLTSYAADLLATSATLLTAGIPPAFSLDRLVASSVTVAGFAIGYLPYGVTDASSNAARVAAAPTNLWDLRGTKKSYPTVITSMPMVAGDRFTVEGFRAYLTAAQVDAVIASKDALTAWTTLDTLAGLS